VLWFYCLFFLWDLCLCSLDKAKALDDLGLDIKIKIFYLLIVTVTVTGTGGHCHWAALVVKTHTTPWQCARTHLTLTLTCNTLTCKALLVENNKCCCE